MLNMYYSKYISIIISLSKIVFIIVILIIVFNTYELFQNYINLHSIIIYLWRYNYYILELCDLINLDLVNHKGNNN